MEKTLCAYHLAGYTNKASNMKSQHNATNQNIHTKKLAVLSLVAVYWNIPIIRGFTLRTPLIRVGGWGYPALVDSIECN